MNRFALAPTTAPATLPTAGGMVSAFCAELVNDKYETADKMSGIDTD